MTMPGRLHSATRRLPTLLRPEFEGSISPSPVATVIARQHQAKAKLVEHLEPVKVLAEKFTALGGEHQSRLSTLLGFDDVVSLQRDPDLRVVPRDPPPVGHAVERRLSCVKGTERGYATGGDAAVR